MTHALKFWLPAITGMVCLALGAGLIGIYGFFVEPLSREFGVGVATLNIGPVALLLVPGIVAPRVGRLVDRLPTRRIMLTGASLAMLSLVAVSQSPTLPLAGLSFLIFALGLTLYGPVVVNGLMVKLYQGREARALAIAAIGISLAGAILPPITGQLLSSLDWREALLALALILLCILWLAVLLVFFTIYKVRDVRLKNVEKRLAAVEPAAQQSLENRQKLKALKVYTDRSDSALECLREVTRLLPPGNIEFASFNYKKGKGVTLRGSSSTDESVYDFFESLTESELFEQLKDQSVNAKTIKGVRSSVFSVTLVLPSEEEAK